MTAVHLWALALGGAALGLPVLVHYLTRARGLRYVYPTYRFVLGAAAARRRLSRLRDFLVLALRTLAVAAVAAAFARLLVRPRGPAAAGGPAEGRWAVVVLDVSQSMAAQGEGAIPLDVARQAAVRLLQDTALRRAEVILAGQRPRAVFGRLSVNMASLREEVARAAALPEALDATAALGEAAARVRPLGLEERKAGEVVVFTDLQRSNWATASFSDLPAEVPVRVIDVRGGKRAPANAAVLRVWSGGPASAGRPCTLVVEAANHGDSPVQRDLELSLGGEILRRGVTLLPRQRRQESFVVTPSSAGPATGRARLAGGRDALSADDQRAVALAVRRECRILLVTAGSPERVGSAPYFLHRALAASAETPFAFQVARPDRLEEAGDPPVGEADLMAIVDPGRLARPSAESIGRLLLRGMPVLYALQGAADADALAEIEAVLGPACTVPVGFSPLDRSAPPRLIEWADPSRRPFRIFGAGLDRFTRPLALSGGLRSAPRGGEEEGRVLARLSDRSAALVVVPAASGRLALLNLPLSGAHHAGKSAVLVPLVQEIALDLLEGPERAGARAAVSGRAFSLPLRAGAEGRRVEDEEGRPAEGARVVEDRGGPMLVWSPAGRPGAYRVTAGGRAEEAFAVGLPPEESDLAAIDARVLEERIARGRPVRVQEAGAADGPDARERELWPLFAAIALACFLLELVVLKAFRT